MSSEQQHLGPHDSRYSTAIAATGQRLQYLKTAVATPPADRTLNQRRCLDAVTSAISGCVLSQYDAYLTSMPLTEQARQLEELSGAKLAIIVVSDQPTSLKRDDYCDISGRDHQALRDAMIFTETVLIKIFHSVPLDDSLLPFAESVIQATCQSLLTGVKALAKRALETLTQKSA